MDGRPPSRRPPVASWELLFGHPGDVRSLSVRLSDELRRLAHAEWIRTGNPSQDCNWREAQKQLGGKLLESGMVQWAAARALESGLDAESQIQIERLEAYRDAAKAAGLRLEVRELKSTLKQRTLEQQSLAKTLRGMQAELQRVRPELLRNAALQNQVHDLEAEVKVQQAELSAQEEHMEARLGDNKHELASCAAEMAMQHQKLCEGERRAAIPLRSLTGFQQAISSPRCQECRDPNWRAGSSQSLPPKRQLDDACESGEARAGLERRDDLWTTQAKQSEAESARIEMQRRQRYVEHSALALCRERLSERNSQLAESEATTRALKIVLDARVTELRGKDSLLEAQQARLHAQDTSLEAVREHLCSSEAARKVLQCEFMTAQAELATSRGLLEEEAAQCSKHHEKFVELQRVQRHQSGECLSARFGEAAALEARTQADYRLALMEESVACERKRGDAHRQSLHCLEVRLKQSFERLHHASGQVAQRAIKEVGTTVVDKASLIFTIRCLDYDLLVDQPALCANFKLAMMEVVASEAGPGVAPSQVGLELWAGSVIVQASITPPSGNAACDLTARLQKSGTLALAVVDKVLSLQGIDMVKNGSISVELHTPAPFNPKSKTHAQPEAAPQCNADARAVIINHRGQVIDKTNAKCKLARRQTERFEISTPHRREIQGCNTTQTAEAKLRGAVRRRVHELDSKERDKKIA